MVSLFAYITALAIQNVPICIGLIYLFGRKKWRSIPLTIIAGTVLSEILLSIQQTNHRWGMEFYLMLAGFTVHTAMAFGLIKLKERITRREEAKYSDQPPSDS